MLILFHSNINQVHVCGNSLMILQNTALRFLKRQRKLRLKVGNVYRMFLNMYYDKSFAD